MKLLDKKENTSLIFITFLISFLLLVYTFKNYTKINVIIQWVLFLPYKLINKFVLIINLESDHAIIFTIIFGLPILIVYWFFIYCIIKRVIKFIFVE